MEAAGKVHSAPGGSTRAASGPLGFSSGPLVLVVLVAPVAARTIGGLPLPTGTLESTEDDYMASHLIFGDLLRVNFAETRLTFSKDMVENHNCSFRISILKLPRVQSNISS